MSSAPVASRNVKAGDIPTTTFGKTGIQVSIIAQGGARMDLHPTIQAAATHVRTVYELGVTYFDCARAYWNGRSEEAYGIGLQGVRQHVALVRDFFDATDQSSDVAAWQTAWAVRAAVERSLATKQAIALEGR